MGGRKTKLTPELQNKIIELLRKGNYRNVVCNAVGIHEDTFYEWIKKGEQGIKPYSEFTELVKKVESEFEIELLNNILEMTKNDPKYALEILSRKYPERWGRKEGVNIKGEIEFIKMDKKEYEKLIDDLIQKKVDDNSETS